MGHQGKMMKERLLYAVIIFNKESKLKRHFRLYLQKAEALFIWC
jgi:hypothetical protein